MAEKKEKYKRLLGVKAVREVCEWRIPNSDTPHSPADSVAFAKKRIGNFLKRADAIGAFIFASGKDTGTP